MSRCRGCARRPPAPATAIDRIEAVLDESGQLMREYPDLAAFEWVIRAESAVALDPQVAGGAGFQAFREIIEGIVDDAYRQGDLADRPDRQSVVEVIYALIYGLDRAGGHVCRRRTTTRRWSSAKTIDQGNVVRSGTRA